MLNVSSGNPLILIYSSNYSGFWIHLHQSPFISLSSYLANEDDLGVLLVGLDALHSLLELFSASEVFGQMLVHFLPVIRQMDRQLIMAAAEGTDPELAALWLLSPLRLAKLYQLRCAANLGTCAESKQARMNS
jgi:hypothetical protein